MRASVASLSKKFISTIFAATLALGLVPAAAFAVEDDGAETPKSAESAEADSLNTEDLDQHVISSEVEKSALIEQNEGEALTTSWEDDQAAVIPAASGRINQDVALQTRTVAQAESTRSYFLAQTLESTHTVPIVSASLPLDTGNNDNNETSQEEESEKSDDPDSDGGQPPVGASFTLAQGENDSAVAAESTVIGSFTYNGITYAVEPGGETVAVVAVDHSKLPETFVEAQIIVLLATASPNDVDNYSVTRIADYAFANLNTEDEGITAVTVPASITQIDQDAFTDFNALQYIIVSSDNPNYSQYDGCLYDADQTCLLLIPEGRLGAVRIAPSVTEVDPEVFSHCPSVDTLVADADSAAYQLLTASDFYGSNLELIDVASTAEANDLPDFYDADYDTLVSDLGGDTMNMLATSALVLDERATLDADSPSNGAYGFSVVDGNLQINFLGSSRYFFDGKMDAQVSWTAGTKNEPTHGSIVNVAVSRYHGMNACATKDQLVNAGLEWGGSQNQELIGIKNSSTGAYLSLDTIYSGGAFTLSFTLPEDNAECSITKDGFVWVSEIADTSFEPVFQARSGAIYNNYDLNYVSCGIEKNDDSTGTWGWQNPATGVFGDPDYLVTTYSTVGYSIMAPSASIPAIEGYAFIGWYTSPIGGSVVSGDAVFGDNGDTYYAHWTRAVYSLEILGMAQITALDSGRSWLYSGENFRATATWETSDPADEKKPAVGTFVNILVTNYRNNDGETTKDMMVNAGLEWLPDNEEIRRSNKLAGIKETTTGSYISFDTLYSGKNFMFSFVMPSASENYVDISETILKIRGGSFPNEFPVTYKATTFEPVYEKIDNAIYSNFYPNGGKWRNPTTKVDQQKVNGYGATTYSEIGHGFQTPGSSIVFNTGYSFVGWYDEDGNVAPEIADIECQGRDYYARWVENKKSLEVNGLVRITTAFSGDRSWIYDGVNFKATVNWEESDPTGANRPKIGTIMTVSVEQYDPNGGEATIDMIKEASYQNYNGRERGELVGIRETTTGSYVSLESLYSGDAFTFAMTVPESGLTLGSKILEWMTTEEVPTTFVPVFKERSDYIVNYFNLNSPKGSKAGWQNPSSPTNAVSMSDEWNTMTYSNLGEQILTPSNSIPVCDGYIFIGWFTEPVGGHIVSGMALEDDNEKTYYAHWGNDRSTYYFLRLHEDANDPSPVSWSIDSDASFSLSARVFGRAGQSIVAWTDSPDQATGDHRYEVEALYDAREVGTTTDFYAQWEDDQYVITYNLDGGEKKAGWQYPTSYVYNSGIVHVSQPVRPGYEFTGWTGTGLRAATLDLQIDSASDDKLGTHKDGTSLYTRTYTAHWRAYSYSIEFYNSDNRNQRASDATMVGLSYDKPVDLVPGTIIVEKAGYHVGGWTPNPSDADAPRIEGVNGTLTTLGSYAPDGDGAVVRLYCVWDGNAFSVKLNEGTGSSRYDVQSGFAYGTDKQITMPGAFAKTGYEITGWSYTANPVESDMDLVGASPIMTLASLKGRVPNEDDTIELYAIWSLKHYDLYIDLAEQGVTLPTTATTWSRGMWTDGSWTASEGAVDKNAVYTYKLNGGYTIESVITLPTPRGGITRLDGWTTTSGAEESELAEVPQGDGVVTYIFKPKTTAADFEVRAYTLLTAQWADADYTIEWVFNYEDAEGQVVNDTYFDDDPDFSNGVLTKSTAYGAPISTPVIKSECYRFLGWYSTVAAAINARYAATTSAGDIYGPYLKGSAEDGYVFEPDDDGGRTVMRFFAAWSEEPVTYIITLKADKATTGHAGLFSNNVTTANKTKSVIELPNTYDATKSRNDLYLTVNKPVSQEAGWEFARWIDEQTGHALSVEETIARGSGNRTFYAEWKTTDNSYKVSFRKGDEVAAAPDYVTIVAGSADNDGIKANGSSVSVPTLSKYETVGYVFDGWRRANETTNGLVLTDETIERNAVFSAQQVVDKAVSSGVDELIYVATWTPKSFVIRYTDGEGAEMEAFEDDGIVRSVSYTDSVKLPVPAFKKPGAVFAHWNDVADSTPLYPNDTVTLSQIIQAVGAPVVEDGKRIVTVNAAWAYIVSSDVPLIVSIAFDPDHFEESVKVSDAWISTTCVEPVFVESVTLEKGDEAAKAFAVAGEGGADVDMSSYVLLTVRGNTKEQPDTLSLNLGQDAVVRGMEQYGLGTFTSGADNQIDVTYGLDFSKPGCPAPTKFKYLNDHSTFKDTGKTHTIAKLFYTIGLVH